MTKAELTRIVKLVTVVATVLLFIVACLAVGLCIKESNFQNQISSLDLQLKDLSITEVSLTEGIEIRSTDAYVEQKAREDLGMIQSGEVIFVVE